MSFFIIDTNVAIVANARGDEYETNCQISCVEKIRYICSTAKHRIVLDEEGEILKEYRAHLNAHGQPGVGDFFYRHLINFRGNQKRVTEVSLEKDATTNEYVAFPDHPDLNGFDHADRKFVAAALITKGTILNAVDPDYSEHKAPLKACGVKVKELCPQCINSN